MIPTLFAQCSAASVADNDSTCLLFCLLPRHYLNIDSIPLSFATLIIYFGSITQFYLVVSMSRQDAPMGGVPVRTKLSRDEKRRHQRESLSAVFRDPLERFSTSSNENLRTVSRELADQEDILKERIRTVSGTSQEELGSFSPPKAKRFLAERETLAEELASHLKASRTAVRDARVSNRIDRGTAKRLLSGTEAVDADLLKERAALAKNRVKLEYGILAHPTHARIGEAYLSAIIKSLPEPAGARVHMQDSRDKTDQQQFKSLLIQAHSPIEERPMMLWCPVTRTWHDKLLMKATHIVPYGIGEINASYVFGLPPEDGYKAIWGVQNGLLLHSRIEEALDAAQLVIVPADDPEKDLKVVILDDSMLDKYVWDGGPTFGDLNHSSLQFLSDARPAKRNLYFHCLISIFRRYRFGVDGREMDHQKIGMGIVWGMSGIWMRRGIMKALALEIGDIVKVEDFVGSEVAVSSFSAKIAEQDRKVAVQIREAVEGTELVDVDDDYNGEGDSEAEEEDTAGEEDDYGEGDAKDEVGEEEEGDEGDVHIS